MVEPENNVAIVAIVGKIGASDRDRLIRVGRKDSEGAGSIETDTFDVAWIDIGLADNTTDTFANALPNVGGRLFLERIARLGYSEV